jgi:hypothetical protein
MDGHLKAWRAHRFLAYLYGIGLLALAAYAYFGHRPLHVHTQFVAFSALPVLCLFHVVAARASLRRQAWARIASLVMGVALLIVFPIGTIFGAWLLMASWQPWPHPREHAGAPRGGWHQDGRR